MKLLVCTSLLLSSMVFLVECYSSGAPAGTCKTLAPDPIKHEADLQETECPYFLDIASFNDGKGGYHYEPGKTYRLTLLGVDRLPFKGFFSEARVMKANGKTAAAGKFNVMPGDTVSRLSSCPVPTDAITHNSPVEKIAVTFEWTAPKPGVGDIKFEFAVVEVKKIYWAHQMTASIKQKPSALSASVQSDDEMTLLEAIIAKLLTKN